ncbi:MAG TPA: cell division protein ZipA C-terminal FtsZ-binding domain-containing protein [Steroidobacteraceae bacterium]
MNELRWILLAAGLLLIAGIYVWGLRSRTGKARGGDAETRPAVFTGGASGFERAEPGVVPEGAESEEERRLSVPAASRRIEPMVSLDDEDVDGDRRADAARIDFDEGVATTPGAGARREPTFTVGSEPMDGGRVEPTLRPRATAPAVEPESASVTRRPASAAPAAPAAETPAGGAAASKPQKPPQRIFALRVTAVPPARIDGAALLEALRSEQLIHGRYEIFHRLHDDGRPVFSVASLKEPGRFDLESMPQTQYPGVALFAVLPGPVAAAEAFDEMLFTARALATLLTGTIGDERGVPLTPARVASLREELLEFERALGSG